MRAGFLFLLLLLGLTACRSPLSASDPDDSADAWPDEEDEVGVGIHAWPLLEHGYAGGKERLEVLWPLYITRRDRSGEIERFALLATLVNYEEHDDGRVDFGFRPFFDDTRWNGTPEDFDVDLLWPFFKSRRRGDERTFGLRPLLWVTYDKNSSRFTLFPLVFTGEGPREGHEHTVVFPVYWSGSDGHTTWTHVWPLYGVDRGETYREDAVLYPFFRYARDGEDGSFEWNVLWPLFHYAERDGEIHVRALPLAWYEASADAGATVLFPFWWNIEDGDSAFRMVFPIYGHQYEGENFERTFLGGPLYIRTRDRDETSTDLLWPIVNHTVDDDGWSMRVFPFLWLGDHSERAGHFHLWPLFGRSRHGDRTEVSTLYPFFTYRWHEDSDDYGFDALWPFVGARREGPASRSWAFPLWYGKSDEESSSGRLGLILSNWESSADGDHDFRILWRLVEHTHEDDRTTFVVRPFWRSETNVDGDSYWSVLMGLLARKEEDGETDWRFLWFF